MTFGNANQLMRRGGTCSYEFMSQPRMSRLGGLSQPMYSGFIQQSRMDDASFQLIVRDTKSWLNELLPTSGTAGLRLGSVGWPDRRREREFVGLLTNVLFEPCEGFLLFFDLSRSFFDVLDCLFDIA